MPKEEKLSEEEKDWIIYQIDDLETKIKETEKVLKKQN